MNRRVGLTLVWLGASLTLVAEAAATAEQSEWWPAARQQIVDSEYHLSLAQPQIAVDAEELWQAPNRTHGLRTYFLERGIRIVPRTDAQPSWELGLTLRRVGREGDWQRIGSTWLPSTDKNRIEYDHGNVTQWYVNDRRGLEQGFVLDERPSPGVDGCGPLQLELALSGSLSPRISSDGRAVDFVDARGVSVLHYANLLVVDASGTTLPARIEGFATGGARGLRIVVDDVAAVYPVVVDPLVTAAAWSLGPGQAAAEFGRCVATAGDVNGDGFSDVVVGAPAFDNGQPGEGRAFVYRGSASGLATLPSWTAEANQANARFGLSVQTAGDVNGDGYSDLIVGCPDCDVGLGSQGRAFVYHGSATGLASNPAWSAAGVAAGDQFGFSVGAIGDIEGDGYGDVIIGAPLRDVGGAGNDHGQASIYSGSTNGIGGTPQTIDGTEAGAQLGFAVAGAGDVNGDGHADVAVGAPYADWAVVDEGRVQVWHGSGSGLTLAKSFSSAGETGAEFGWSLSTAGDVDGDGYADLVVGAPGLAAAGGGGNAGRIYSYMGSATGVQDTAQWSADGQPGDRHGVSVATAGDVNGDGYADVIAGAEHYTNVEPREGGAVVYFGTAGGLDKPSWDNEANLGDAFYGSSVGTAGDVNGDGYSDVIVGAYGYANDEGFAYVYHGGAAGVSISSWNALGTSAAEDFGFSVASAGDVNGDGFADILVGAPGFDHSWPDEGKVFLFPGSPTGPTYPAAWSNVGGQPGAMSGWSVASAGDVNGDGYSDVIIGAPYYDTGSTDAGKASLFVGGSATYLVSGGWALGGIYQNGLLGFSVSTAGDVNGDGFSDVIIGEPGNAEAASAAGLAYVFEGSPTGLPTTTWWSTKGPNSDAQLGRSVSTAGDVDGDGFSDVVIGVPQYGPSMPNGEAWIFHGATSGLVSASLSILPNDQAGARFGEAVAAAGDVNGDGYSDVIVGAPLYSNGETEEGLAYVYHGSGAGIVSPAAWVTEGNQNFAVYGAAVGAAGDINGDGFADVVVGAPKYDSGEIDEGVVFVYHGSAAGLPTVPTALLEPNQASAGFGASTRSAGDVDGDGYADLIVGAPKFGSIFSDEGSALLYLGNGSEGSAVARIPQQRRVDNAGLIAHLGVSDQFDRFRLRLQLTTPFGRAGARLEYEVKKLGQLLDGTNTVLQSVYSDTGVGGITTDLIADSLESSTVHHWRLRTHYDPVTVPFQPHGRWITVPLNGWQEADLRTTGDTGEGGAGVVGDSGDGGGEPVQMEKTADGQFRLYWGSSCGPDDDDYGVYAGTLGEFASHTALTCSTGGATEYTISADPAMEYYLVVPVNTGAGREGAYGTGMDQLARPRAVEACYPQALAACATE